MRLTKEILEAAVMGYLLAAGEKPQLNGHKNGFVERSKHQRRRGRPPKSIYKAISASKPGVLMKVSADALKTKKRKYTKRSAYWKNPVKA